VNPFAPFLERQSVVILDGGLSTALEGRGHDLSHRLWSAKLLVDAPEEIGTVTREYLEAGADCVGTATYQATTQGFRELGLSGDEAVGLLRGAVELAVEARDDFWSDPANRRGRLRPLVAASIGPYGAYLADGSEYSGRYGLTERELYDFHGTRFDVLADSDAELLAVETIPSLPEVRALLRLVEEHPSSWVWVSFCCRDGEHLWDGSELAEAVSACDAVDRVAAIGVNCVSPELVSDLIGEIRSRTDKPVAVYPNSGESYDPEAKNWDPGSCEVDWQQAPKQWARAGAEVIGGCCRVGPETICVIRQQLLAT
jgi:homocysteine S-methyltransferase